MPSFQFYENLLQNGLRISKFKHSQIQPIQQQDNQNKGAVFGYRSKPNMIATRGFVMTSTESVFDNQDELTHWTPNVYCYGTYADENKTYTKGNSEKNLKQINTFVVDIDSKNMPSNALVLTCSDEIGFLPTLIMETDKGYQLYFVLESPSYVTKKSNYKSIQVAKKISTTIRKKLAKVIKDVDLGCNHFGVSRFPNQRNIVMCEPSFRYSFNQWLQWSMKVATDEQTEESYQRKVVQFPQQSVRQIDEPWFDLIQKRTDFIGAKSTLGRNNAVFTLALAYYSSGKSKSNCAYNLTTFNDSLTYCLSSNELNRIIESAYSGDYQGASRDFILELCHEWISTDIQSNDLFTAKGWYKFKKARSQRKYSHINEWEADFIAYMDKNCNGSHPYLVTSKKTLKEELSIPERSLDKLLAKLKTNNKIIFESKRGRNGGLYIASVKQLLLQVIAKKQALKEEFINGIEALFNLTEGTIQKYINQLATVKYEPQAPQKITLFADTS